MTSLAGILLLRLAWAIACLCASAGVHAQAAAEQVGLVLAAEGEVVVDGQAGGAAVPAYSVLHAGTSLRLGKDATARLVHHKEGVTYSVKGPAVVSVLAQRLVVEPPAAVVAKATGTSPVEKEARGDAAIRGDRPDARAGGENLDTSRSGLEAATKAGPVRASMQPDEGWSTVLVVIGWLVALGILLFVLKRLALKYGIALAALLLAAVSYYYLPPSQNTKLEKAAQEKAHQGEAAKERAAQEKAAQERLAQEKAAQEKAAQEKAAQEKAAAPAPTKAPQAAAKPAVEAPQHKLSMATGAAERMALREQEAARKAAEARGDSTSEAKAGEPEQVASASPSLSEPGASPLSTLSLYEQGKAAEASGNVKAAVRLYIRAIRAGDYRAARALGDIYADGKGDVAKDYGESLKYYALAEKHGIKFERSSGRGR